MILSSPTKTAFSLFLLRGLLGALAVIAAQLVLAMVIRSFAVPIFLGLLGGIRRAVGKVHRRSHGTLEIAHFGQYLLRIVTVRRTVDKRALNTSWHL